jgi:hypothetical protein
MEATPDESEKLLREAGLESAGRDVVFPFGFKIVDFNGRKALQPLTPEEYRNAVKGKTGRIYLTNNC